MKKLLLILLLPICAYAQSQNDRAIGKLSEALPKVPAVKDKIKSVERKLINAIEENTFLDRDSAGFIISSAVIASQGKISTKPIKNMKLQVFSGEVRPDIEYDFKDGDTKTTINSSWDF